MAKHNLTQAAKLVGVSRSTINRHIKEGKISKDLDENGKPVIDTAELQRVYGDLSHDTVSQDVPMTQHRTPNETPEKDIEIVRLETELKAANDRIADQAEQITDLKGQRDKWQQQAANLALPAPQTETPTQAEKSTAEAAPYQLGWFDRLMGRKPL